MFFQYENFVVLQNFILKLKTVLASKFYKCQEPSTC